jgi:hypothetical protein
VKARIECMNLLVEGGARKGATDHVRDFDLTFCRINVLVAGICIFLFSVFRVACFCESGLVSEL